MFCADPAQPCCNLRVSPPSLKVLGKRHSNCLNPGQLKQVPPTCQTGRTLALSIPYNSLLDFPEGGLDSWCIIRVPTSSQWSLASAPARSLSGPGISGVGTRAEALQDPSPLLPLVFPHNICLWVSTAYLPLHAAGKHLTLPGSLRGGHLATGTDAPRHIPLSPALLLGPLDHPKGARMGSSENTCTALPASWRSSRLLNSFLVIFLSAAPFPSLLPGFHWASYTWLEFFAINRYLANLGMLHFFYLKEAMTRSVIRKPMSGHKLKTPWFHSLSTAQGKLLQCWHSKNFKTQFPDNGLGDTH